LGDADLIPANILLNKVIFGVTGNVIAGKRSASCTIVSSSTNASFITIAGVSVSKKFVSVTGLSFLPKLIYVKAGTTATEAYTIYEEIAVSGGLYPKTIKMAGVDYTETYSSDYMEHYKGDAGYASVTNGGFILPVKYNAATYTWAAYE